MYIGADEQHDHRRQAVRLRQHAGRAADQHPAGREPRAGSLAPSQRCASRPIRRRWRSRGMTIDDLNRRHSGTTRATRAPASSTGPHARCCCSRRGSSSTAEQYNNLIVGLFKGAPVYLKDVPAPSTACRTSGNTPASGSATPLSPTADGRAADLPPGRRQRGGRVPGGSTTQLPNIKKSCLRASICVVDLRPLAGDRRERRRTSRRRCSSRSCWS